MKIIHTSDWHLGHLLYNDSQEEAHKDMFEQMKKIVREQKPDVFLVSGDIYDTTQPSAAVQQVFADAILDIHKANPEMTIVCIAGNHDSGSKHMIFHTPWLALNVHMIGNITKDSNLEDYIIEVDGKGFVVAVPFAADRFMPEDVFTRLSEKVSEKNAEKQLPVVLMAHLAIMKSIWTGHDFSSETNIGGLNCTELTVFGDDYDYVALGHIHRQQQLDKDGRVRYSGTPIPVSFDEVESGNTNGVLLVECEKHKGEVKVESIGINNIRPLVNLPIDGFKDWDSAKRDLSQYPADIQSFIRLNVEVDDYLPAGANDEAQMLVKDKVCRLCLINTRRKNERQQTAEHRSFSASEFKKLDIEDVAKMWIESQGDDFTDEMRELLQEIKTRISTNNRN